MMKPMFDLMEMPNPCFERAIVYSDDEKLRKTVSAELGKLGCTTVDVSQSIEACLNLLDRDSEAILVIDWRMGEQKCVKLLNKSQGRYKVDTRPIYLVTELLTNELVALAAEFNVSRIHVGSVAAKTIASHLRDTFEECTTGLPGQLRQVAAARSKNDWQQAEDLLLAIQKRYPENNRIQNEIAENHIQAGKWSQAEKIA